MTKCIYIATGANLPDQNASALRVSSIISALSLYGYSFTVIGQCKADENTDYVVNDNYKVRSTYNVLKQHSFWQKVKTFLFPTKMVFKQINEIIKNEKIDYLFIYQIAPIRLMKKIINLCEKNNIALVFDIVEYQNLSQQRNLIGYWFNYRPAKRIITHFTKYGKVISISSYLKTFFENRSVPSIFVPFFFDVKKISNNSYSKGEHIRIVYAGAPFGSRDTIINAVRSLLLLSKEEADSFRFVFAGVTREQMKELGLKEEELIKTDCWCSYLGRISHDDVLKLYSQSDYSLLLKPVNKRLSKAGFPTKVSESWALSTPVIANLTGDMDKYMVDGFNGIESLADSPADCANALKKALSFSEEEYLNMRNNSRKTAENQLDITVFAELIKKFVEK